MKRLHYANFNLAGFTYWDGALVFDRLKIGTQLRLVRELDNRYGTQAVAIYFEEYMIGDVPKAPNSVIAKFCEQGFSFIF